MPSTGRSGTPADNAVAESFFATLQAELLDRSVWPTKAACAQPSSSSSRPSTTGSAATRASHTSAHTNTRGGTSRSKLRSQALNCPLKRGQPPHFLPTNEPKDPNAYTTLWRSRSTL